MTLKLSYDGPKNKDFIHEQIDYNSLFIVFDGDCKKKYLEISRMLSHTAMQTMEHSKHPISSPSYDAILPE